ncbi:MAG: TetR/AcrR family transcriptional regulator [Mycobacterium sp.]|uniref:TetR/AcrR family transcriptional regulator n=1 Tax=Mycobacterium sp. TaxID=1785 RepID=UPI003C4473CE
MPLGGVATVRSISALTRRTRLSTGALYHHFGSKSGLLAAIYDAFYEGLGHAIADTHLPADADWATRERERTRRFVAYHFADPLAPVLLNRTALDPQLTELEVVYIQNMSDDAADDIRRGQAAGQLPADIDADSAGAFVIGGLRHGIAQQLRIDPPFNPDQATDRLWRLTAGALGLT